MRGIKTIRLPHYDYKSDGWYFVTICSHSRLPLLTGETRKIVVRLIRELRRMENGISVDVHVIMPNHLHMIIVLEHAQLSLGEIIRRFKARATRSSGHRLWQPNYFEHIIRTENEVRRIREYIINNPAVDKIPDLSSSANSSATSSSTL